MKYAEIVTEIRAREVNNVFFYKIPEAMTEELMTGMRVSVPFGRGNRITLGYVIGISDEPKTSAALKEIIDIKDRFPVFSKERIELARWMEKKYYCTLSDCLQCIIPKITGAKRIKYVFLDGSEDERRALLDRNNRQAELLRLLEDRDGISLDDIRKKYKIGGSTIKSLEKKGVIKITGIRSSRDAYDTENPNSGRKHTPTPDQQRIIDAVCEDLDRADKKPFLLKGVTGSGKTLVYTEIIAEVLRRGRQAIMLVPEISLTPQTVQRFIDRFGSLVTVTHSKMTDGERYDQWEKARSGRASVMIGPRSAVFAPFDNLGVIIIDEEHEKTYKSEHTPKYDAREIALKLKDIYGATVVFGSATPSIDSFYKAKTGEYRLLELDKRINMKMPDVFSVDMRDEIALGNKSIFSLKLQNAIRETLENKKQIILFLNRRGHSTFVSCRQCGYVMTCESCSVSYTYHSHENRLMCHYCGSETDVPKTCPACGSKYIKYFGVGTEKIEAEAARLFPGARVLRMDMDTTKSRNSHRQILSAFAEGRADILVGTQMIAKGLDFPGVTLVGIVAADLSLNSSDYRAMENTFALITQVSGRAGRADSRGKVLIQTYMPENYCIEFARKNDYEGFYREEIEFRRQMNYPPFSHICVVMLVGEDERKVISVLHYYSTVLEYYARGKNYDKIGPAAAAVSKIGGKYRHRIIVRGQDEEKLRNYVFYCLDILKKKADMRDISVNVTMDPTYIP